MPLGGPVEEQLMLLPARTAAEAAVWGSAAMEYAAAFERVHFARDPEQVDWRGYARVTVVNPSFWPADLPVLIKQANPTILIDRLQVEIPEALRAILNMRVYHGWRYGPQTDTDWRQVWPVGKCLIGLHGRTTGEMFKSDYAVVKTARIEALKVTSHTPPDAVRTLLNQNPNLFLMVRPMVAFMDRDTPRQVTPAQFVEWTVDDLERIFAVAPGLRYVEIHNEPNIGMEGWGGSWPDGAAFGDWFLEVLNSYRARWPGKLFGFPGLSPGPASNYAGRANPDEFLAQAAAAALEADWVGLHSYWVTESEVVDASLGLNIYHYRELFPEKLLFITEFGNPFQGQTLVAEQYARYYGMLRQMPGLGAAFAYVVSSPNPIEAGLVWRDEAGNDTGIAALVGQRPFIAED